MNRLQLLGKAHRKRYKLLLTVISKYGLDEVLGIKRLQKVPLVGRFKRKSGSISQLTRAERIRLAIEEMGGAFVKIGQILSNRPDLLPEDVITELVKLQDNIPPFPSEKAVEIIETELECKIKDIFLMFDPVPLASGSIAQIHRGVLLDLTPVVIKIQRPEIAEQIRTDFDILIYATKHLSKFTSYKKQFKEKNPFKELGEELEKELDFKNEEGNILHFIKNFKDDKRVLVPKVYPDYGTKNVMVMDYIEGIKITDKEKMISKGFDPVKIADVLMDVGLKQIFEHFFFHGDPHPGNILLLDNGKVSFIDFGLMGSLSSKQQKVFNDMVIAFAQQDTQKITRIIQNITPKDNAFDINHVEYDISKIMDTYYDKSLKEINVGELLKSIMKFLTKYDLVLPTNIYLLIKSVSSYEGIGRKLNPDFEIAPYAKKYATKLIRKNLSPKNFLKDLYLSSSETVNLIKEFPGEMRNLIQLVQQGRLTVNANLTDLRGHVDYIFKKLEKISNRIIYALLLSSVIIGTSLLLRNVESEKLYGIPVFAGIGFVLALILTFMLLISILRSKTL